MKVLEYLEADLDLITPDEPAIPSDRFSDKRNRLAISPDKEVTSDKIFKDSFDNRMPATTLHPGQYLPRTGWRLKHPSELFEHIPDSGVRQWLVECLEGCIQPLGVDDTSLEGGDASKSQQILPTINLTKLDVLRWRMAWGAPRLGIELMRAKKRHHCKTYKTLIVSQCRDWDGFDQIQNCSTMIGLSFGAFIYGGLHALAWYAIFDSRTQELLWRLSSSVVTGGFPLIFVSLAIKSRWERRFPRFKKLARLVPAPAIALYVRARGYLVIECFINLFNLPAEVYKVPNWTAYFPHIS